MTRMTNKEFMRLVQQTSHKPVIAGKPRNKYNASKTVVVMPDGSKKTFSSQKEAARAVQLSLSERMGAIRNLRFQVPFELVPHQVRPDGTKEQPVRYIADFVYEERVEEGLRRMPGQSELAPTYSWRTVVEDVKGYRDPASAAYKLFTVKRKLMLLVHGIVVKEV